MDLGTGISFLPAGLEMKGNTKYEKGAYLRNI